MLEEPTKKFSIKIGDIRDSARSNGTVIFANSVSKGVELFLQDYLKNNRLTVEITEHNVTERKI